MQKSPILASKIMKNFFIILSQFFKIFFFGLTLFLLFVSFFKKEWIENFIEWMKIQIDNLGFWNYLIAGLSNGIEALPVLGTLLPGQNILLLVGGFFGSVSLNNLLFLILFSSIGGIIGNFIGYFLGKKYGETFFEKYGLWLGIGKTEVKYLEKGIKKWGAFGIIIGKFHPLTRSFLPFIAGSMKMKPGIFMLYNAIGAIVYSVVIIGIGILFIENYKIVLKNIGYIMFGIFAIIGLYIYFYKKEEFKKYMDEKNLEIKEKIEKSK